VHAHQPAQTGGRGGKATPQLLAGPVAPWLGKRALLFIRAHSSSKLATDHSLRGPELGGHLRVELLAAEGLALDLQLTLTVGIELEAQVYGAQGLATLRDGTV